MSPPPVPDGNPMSDLKVALGERLFNDPRLSVTGTQSCATCHDPGRSFTDGRKQAVGATGQLHPRNTPSLWNVAYNVSYTWLDAGLLTLEEQMRIPLTGKDPVEMGFTAELLPVLEGDVVLMANHRTVFGDTPLSLDTIIKAIAAYVRTLVRMDSAFDRYLLHDEDSGMSAEAKAGITLFFSERIGCGNCHAGAHLSGPTWQPRQTVQPVFHRTAVSDAIFPVRAPSLRFVRQTAPYMHDGSLPTLDAVIGFYERGGGKNAERLRPFELSGQERKELKAFLEAL
jgi:cytochrome c peroxidase